MTTPTFDRRQLLQAGSLSVALAALVAACGGDSAEEAGAPGRVGYAPPATPLPDVETNDIVYLRTTTSIEQTLVETYEQFAELGVLDGQAATVLDRLIEDHRAAVTATAELTADTGGEAYECANSWYVQRVITPIVDRIVGDESQDIPPSDDPARDTLTVVNGMESMAGAMYQQMVELLTAPELRGELMTLGAASARHAAAVAILATGAPDGYASPDLTGADVVADESGLTPLYAISSQFGSLAAIPIVIGAPNDAGVRTTVNLETPAANSFVYEGETCETP
jgi:hypothetical protein